MELDQIETFLVLCEELHFGRTAELLYRSQPRVSRLIASLETEIGAALFDRTSRSVSLTPIGTELQARWRPAHAELLATYAAAKRNARALRISDTVSGTVRIGYIYSAVFETLPLLVSAMNKSHPAVTIEVRDGWTPELDAGLLDDSYDLVLSRDVPHRPEYERETLRYERLVAVVDEEHPMVERGRAELRDFAGQRFCHPPRRLAPKRHDFMMGALERTGQAFEYWESPIHGLGHLDLSDRCSFALVVGSVVSQVPVGTTTVAIIDDLPTLDLQMVWKRDITSPALQRLVETACNVAQREHWTYLGMEPQAALGGQGTYLPMRIRPTVYERPSRGNHRLRSPWR